VVPTIADRCSGVTPERIRDHYDQFAWAYRFYWGDHIHHGLFRSGAESPAEAQVLMLRHCAQQARVRSGSIIADVGCGHGGATRFLAHEYSCRVLGITNSATQFKLAQKLDGAGPVKFELADAEAYRFPHSSFDLVWNMESTEHFFDKPSWFRKAAAALKPGGRLMVAAWTGSMQHELVQNIARVFLCPELLTTDQYIQQVEDAGLRTVSREQLSSEVAPTWDICAQHVRQAGPLLSFLPYQFHEFAQGIELMRAGYRTGQLGYSVIVAEKR
jgi:cyclopropane fatty-acyl-phospholipid synthase-like methyltransferase